MSAPHLFGSLFESITNGLTVKQTVERDGIPITRIETIANGSIDPNRFGYAGIASGACSDWLLRPGDILFSHINSVNHIGKCAVYEGSPELLLHGMNLLLLRPKKDLVYPEYLKHLIRSPDFRRSLAKFVKPAVNQASVSISDLKRISVAMPPLQEQRRLASILNQVDEIRRARRHSVELLNNLHTSLFELTINSVPTDQQRSVALGELIKVKSGEALIEANQKGGSVPVYGGNGICGYHDSHTVPAGTIVIGRVGIYCGAVHVTTNPAWVTDNALIVENKRSDLLRTSYLAAALRHANLNQYAGRSAQPLVSGNRIYPIAIPVPTLDAQDRFERKTGQVTDASRICAKQSALLEELHTALQQRVFPINVSRG